MQRRAFLSLASLACLGCTQKPVAIAQTVSPADTRLRFISGTEGEEIELTGPKADQIREAMARLEKGIGVTRQRKTPGLPHGAFTFRGRAYQWQGSLLYRRKGDSDERVQVPFMMDLSKKFAVIPGLTWQQAAKVTKDYFASGR